MCTAPNLAIERSLRGETSRIGRRCRVASSLSAPISTRSAITTALSRPLQAARRADANQLPHEEPEIPQAAPMRPPATGQLRRDAAPCQLVAMRVGIVAAVPEHEPRFARRAPGPPITTRRSVVQFQRSIALRARRRRAHTVRSSRNGGTGRRILRLAPPVALTIQPQADHLDPGCLRIFDCR
jgi:hypothetical protein